MEINVSAIKAKKIQLSPQLIGAVICAIYIFFIWWNRFLPLQDYPDLLFQGFLFSGFLKGIPPAGYEIGLMPVPNATAAILLGFFNLIFNPEISGKICLSLYLVLFICGIYYFLNSFDSRFKNWGYFIPLLFVFSLFFFMGNINYLFSLCILFFAMGHLVRCRKANIMPKVYHILLFSLAIYFSHIAPYLIYLLAILSFFGFRKIRMIFALFPTLIFSTVWFLNTMGAAAGYIKLFNPLARTAAILHHSYSIFFSFYPFEIIPDVIARFFEGINIIFIDFLLFIIWKSLFSPVSSAVEKSLRNTIFLCLFPTLLFAGDFPFSEFGGRFLLPILFFCLPLSAGICKKNNLQILITMLIILQTIFTFTFYTAVSRELTRIYSIFSNKITTNNLIRVDLRHFNYEGKYRAEPKKYYLLPLVSPLDRMPSYLYLERKKINFYDGTSNLGIINQTSRSECGYLNRLSKIKNLRCNFDFIILLGREKDAAMPIFLLKDRYVIGWRDPYFTILRRIN